MAVIGSFNLTHAALTANVEIGVRLTGISEEGRRIISELEGKLPRLARRAIKGARL